VSSSGEGFEALLAWKISRTLLSVQRLGSVLPIDELDKARIRGLKEGVLTLAFSSFDKSFTFSQADVVEKVPPYERNSFAKAVRLSGGYERVILLQVPPKR
jgi:hypothetical protein